MSTPKPHPSTSSVAASPARTCPSPASERESPVPAPASGQSSSGAFAYFDPASSSWRTCQSSLLISDTFTGRWPSSGSMRNGVCSARPRSAPRTAASGCSSLPTPVATDSPTRSNKSPGSANRRPGLEMVAARDMFPTPMASDSQAGSQAASPQLRDLFWPTPTATDAKSAGKLGNEREFPSLREVVRLWPTPCARDDHGPRTGHTKGGSDLPSAARTWATPKANDAMQPGATPGKSDARQPLTTQVGGGRLNPTWVEWLMGFPLGWTLVDDEPASAALGMASSPSKRQKRL